MSVTLSNVYNLTTEMFFREYVCEKILFALTSPWPLDGKLVNNYSNVKERRYEARLYEEEGDDDTTTVLVIYVKPLWDLKYTESQIAEPCELTFEFKNADSRPEGMVMLRFSILGLFFSMCFDFREEHHSKGKYFYAPAYVQANNLAFMIAVMVETYCYPVRNYGNYNESLGFSANMKSSIEGAINTWNHPRPPDKLVLFEDKWNHPRPPDKSALFEDTSKWYNICCEFTDNSKEKRRFEMISITESSDHEYKSFNIKFKRGGGVDISFTNESNDERNSWLLLYGYCAVLEVYHRAKGVDTFCVLEKLRNPDSVECADFVSNAVLTSGFKCFSYVKRPEMAKLESVEEVLSVTPEEETVTPEEETVDQPTVDESMLEYVANKLVEENIVPDDIDSEDMSLLMGSVGGSADPFSVGGDLPPGHLHEIEQEEFEAVLVRGDDEEDLVNRMEAMKTGVTEDDKVVGRKKKKSSLFAVYFQPLSYNTKIKSTFTPRKPLDNDLYKRLNAYSLAIKGHRSVVLYVDNEVDKLFDLAHAMSSVKDDGSDASIQSFKEAEDKFNAAEEALKTYISRQNSAYDAAEKARKESNSRPNSEHESAPKPTETRSTSRLKAILTGRPIVFVPDKVKAKAGALFASPGTIENPDRAEWQRLYSEVMVFEDYMMLKMMKLKKEYLVGVLSRRENLKGMPKGMPRGFDKTSAVRIEIGDLAEYSFACTLIQYTPTYYIDGGSLYFPREEFRVFMTMMEAWLAENSANAVKRMAESLDKEAPMSEADMETMSNYGLKLHAFNRMLAKASGQKPR